MLNGQTWCGGGTFVVFFLFQNNQTQNKNMSNMVKTLHKNDLLTNINNIFSNFNNKNFFFLSRLSASDKIQQQ